MTPVADEQFARDSVAGRLTADLGQQTTELAVALGKSVAPRRAIYLDTRYWIILRDAQRGLLGDQGIELLTRLRSLVHLGHVFCPVGEAVFFELFRQSDAESRRQTAELADDLSLGSAILGGRERMVTELAHFVHDRLAPVTEFELNPLRELVWTRMIGIVGIRMPYMEALNFETAVEIQRRAVNRVWRETSLTAMVAGDAPWNDDDFVGLTQQLNIDVHRHKDSLRSFKATLQAESAGVADVCSDMAMTVVADIAHRLGKPSVEPGSAAWLENQRVWRNLLATALSKPVAKAQLRSMHVAAALHAAFRWNKGQKFDGHDIYDFEHAGAALSHCQAFFTERPLWQMVTGKNIALDLLFNCRVIWRVEDAINYLARLAADIEGP